MRFTTILPALFLSAATAVPVADEEYSTILRRAEAEYDLLRRQIPSKPCSHLTGGLHVIALGGANTDNPKDYGYLGSLATKILDVIPGSTNISMPYNKVLMTKSPPKLYPNAVPDGMRLLKQYTVDYHHSCPNTKMAIIGYSSGAVIMMNDLCYGGSGQGTPQLNPLINGKYIVGTVAYGEETYTPGQAYNKGTCTSGKGVAARANPSTCYPYASNLASYCDSGDPDCCVGQGTQDVNVHFSYPAKYDAIAANFIKSQFNKYGGA